MPTKTNDRSTLYASLLNFTHDAIVVVGTDQRIEFFNEAACELFGYTEAEILGQPLSELIPIGRRSGHDHHVNQFAIQAQKSQVMYPRGDITAVRKDGAEVYVETTICKVPTAEGMKFAALVRDLTDRRKLEEANLEASNRQAETAAVRNTMATVLDVALNGLNQLGYFRMMAEDSKALTHEELESFDKVVRETSELLKKISH